MASIAALSPLRPSGFAVLQRRVPIRSATFGREVQEIPQRPDHVGVAGMLTRLRRDEQKLRAKRVANDAVAAREDVERGHLRALLVLAVIVAVVAVVRAGE